MMGITHRYLLGNDAAAAQRLRVLDAVYGASSRALLERAGLRAGWRCADIGCGTGPVAMAMAERVGVEGRVVGVDQVQLFLDGARQQAFERGLANVEFVCSDAYTLATAEVWSPGFSRQMLPSTNDGFGISQSFLQQRSAPAKAGIPNLPELSASLDLVYARCLLSHLAEPLRVLGAMARLARSGGSVCVEDIDCGGVFAHPEAPALMRHLDLYQKVIRLHGGDPLMGRKLPRLCRQAGLTDVHFEIVTPTEPATAVKRLYPMTLACLRPAIVEAGLATPSEVDAAVAELQVLADDPNETMSSTPMVQVWARKP